MKIKNVIENFFFPRKCIFCNKNLPITADKDYCDCCSAGFKRDRLCDKCGVPLDIPRGQLICRKCKNKRRYFVRNISRFVYKDNPRNAVLDMKFRKNGQWIAKAYGELVAKTVKEEYGDIKFDGVAFVPISLKREQKRGYNQAEIMAEVVAKELGVPVKIALVKIKDNPKQSGLTVSKRASNVKGVYDLGLNSVQDMTVLLIDDVYTTGATLNECARVLKKGGALLVYCATACITKRGERFCVSENTLKKLRNG